MGVASFEKATPILLGSCSQSGELTLLFYHYLLAINDVQSLTGNIDALTGEVIDDGLATLLVVGNVVDTHCAGRILYPVDV